MSFDLISSSHSSSTCCTAHISLLSALGDDADERDTFSLSKATAQRSVSFLPTETLAMTPPDSNVFLSPVSEPTGTGETPSPSDTSAPTTAGNLAARRQRVSLLVEAGLNVSQVLSVKHRPSMLVGDQSMPDVRGNTKLPTPAELEKTSPTSGDYIDGRPFINSSVASPIVQSSGIIEASGSASAEPPHLGSRRSLSCPLVPTSRGLGSSWLRLKEAENGARDAHPLPPLPPPPRLPSILLGGAGNKYSSNTSTLHLSPPAQDLSTLPLDEAVHSDAGAAAQPPTGVASAADSKSKWWSSVHQLFVHGSEHLQAYLDTLVNPGGVSAATARTPASDVARRGFGQGRSHAYTLSTPASSTPSTPSTFGFPRGTSRHASAVHTPFPSGPGARLGGATEPFHDSTEAHSNADDSLEGGPSTMPLDLVVIDRSRNPFSFSNRTIGPPVLRDANPESVNNSFTGADSEEGPDAGDYEGMPNTYVVDLLSALRGYHSNPTEPFGHLVAAALASRSPENPVLGFEIAAADHNPYLVRLIVDSGSLAETDREAQRNVQETVNELLSINDGELNPVIYDYLISLFRMPFVRLSHKQYTKLKRCGFEYIKLMYDNQHVLPEEPVHSILINQSRTMCILNLIFMVLLLFTTVLSNVSISLVLAKWVTEDRGHYESFGIYTLVVFGGGWALNLIFIVCTVRSRQDEQRYESRSEDGNYLRMPSPYAAMVPVLPLFDIFCIVAYVRALKQKRMILGHNIVACSRLSGIFYSVLFAFPHMITQSYFNVVADHLPQFHYRWPYLLLISATIMQWSVSLFGYAWLLFTHDSIDGLGFACFDRGKPLHPLEQHSALVHLLHFLMAALLETNLYLLTTSTIEMPSGDCDTDLIVIISLSSFTIVYIIIIYIVIISTEGSTVRISFSSVPLMISQAALLVCITRSVPEECASFHELYFQRRFIFGYLSWAAYFSIFILWIILMILWCILYKTGVNLFPRLLWPLSRKGIRFLAPPQSAPSDESFPKTSSLQMPQGSPGRATHSPSL